MSSQNEIDDLIDRLIWLYGENVAEHVRENEVDLIKWRELGRRKIGEVAQ